MAAAVSSRCTYMVASQRELPGSGLDYSAIDFTADNGFALGKSICDSLMSGRADEQEMAVIQLGDVPRLLESCDHLEKSVDPTVLEPFTLYETNGLRLADLGGMISTLPDDEKDVLQSLLSKCMVYVAINGGPDTCGLSLDMEK
jgi:hypothetical protein